MFAINHDDPRATAAAALSLAAALAPDLDAGVAGLSGPAAAAATADLAGCLEGRRLFESRTLTALHRLRKEIAAAVEHETAQAVSWEPVRYVDGAEDYEPVAVHRRTPEGDALAAVGARLDRLIARIERVRALLAAERAIGRRR